MYRNPNRRTLLKMAGASAVLSGLGMPSIARAQASELTIAYNHATFDEPLPPWDPRWSFDCACGSPGCQGRVDDWRRDPT